MAPSPPPSPTHTNRVMQQEMLHVLAGENSMDNAVWGPQSQPQSLSPPYVYYRRLAIEVATRIAPDLQEMLEITIKATMIQMQADTESHNELEQRDENNSLSTKLLSLESKMAQMGGKMEDLQNKSLCNNLRLLGLPVTITARDLHQLCETELPQALGINRHCRVERAHGTSYLSCITK